jgi:hypothetical protein
MTNQEKQLLLGMLSHLDSLLEVETQLFIRERPFLFTGGKAEVIPLPPEYEKLKQKTVLKRIHTARAIHDYLDKINPPLPTKQENLI